MKQVAVILTLALVAFGCADASDNGGAGGTAGSGGAAGAGGMAGAGGGTVPDPITKAVSLICSNNLITANISYLPYELTAAPLGPVIDGSPVDISFTGTGFFPASFLNAGLPFGLTAAIVVELNASVVVRSGATQPGVVLTLDGGLPQTVIIPIEEDDATCAAAGFAGAPCVLNDLALPLNSGVGTLTPDGGAGGEILVGWDETEDPSTLPNVVDVDATAGLNGIRLDAGLPFNIALECTMGECADVTCTGDSDVGVPLLDAQLLSIPIAP
jgi:hypothetical protein